MISIAAAAANKARTHVQAEHTRGTHAAQALATRAPDMIISNEHQVTDAVLAEYQRYAKQQDALVRKYGVHNKETGQISIGDPKNTTISDHYSAYGDARLEYLLDQIRRESGSDSLAALLTVSGDRK